jgi:hypothetical protein
MSAQGSVAFQPKAGEYLREALDASTRASRTGWSDGLGHIGAWGGSIISGSIFMAAAPLGWILLISIPGALVPGVLVGTRGMRQRRAVLEKLSGDGSSARHRQAACR